MNVIVTGASKGLGYELVRGFASNKDNNIIAIARSEKLLQQLKVDCQNEYANTIYTCSIDFLSDSFQDDLNTVLKSYNQHIDILINNAGVLFNLPFSDSLNIVEDTFKINYLAPATIINDVLKIVDKEKGCHIINIGSMGGFQGSVKFPGLSIYSSSKAALANLTECLAEEYKDSNIKFNCLALGSVQTEMLEKAFPDYKAQMSAKEMADYIIEFASNGHLYFNGKVIPVSKNTP